MASPETQALQVWISIPMQRPNGSIRNSYLPMTLIKIEELRSLGHIGSRSKVSTQEGTNCTNNHTRNRLETLTLKTYTKTERGSNIYLKMKSLSSEIHRLAPSSVSSCLGHLLLAKSPTQGSKMASFLSQNAHTLWGLSQSTGSCK